MMLLWRYLSEPGRGHFQFALLLSAIAGASGVVLLGLSGWFLTSAALAGLAGLGHVFNHLNPSAGVRLAAFFRVGSRYAEQLVGHDATLRLSARLRPQIFERGALTGRGMSPMASGELSALIDNIEESERGFLRILSPSLAVLASVCVALAFAFAADLVVGLISLIAFMMFGLALPLHASKKSSSLSEVIAKQSKAARENISRIVENAEELDVIGALKRKSQECHDTLEGLLQMQNATTKPYLGLGSIMSLAGGLLAVFVLFRVPSESNIAISVGASLALLAAFDACAAMIKVFDAAPQANTAGRLILQLLKAESDIVEPPVELAHAPSRLLPLTLESLTTQAALDAPIIGPVSLVIEAGDYIQIVGKSGSGKSTLGECLMKLQPVLGGRLSYGGTDHALLRKAHVLSKIAIASQFPSFMAGTLRDQFTFVKPSVSDDEIWSALAVAQVDEVVIRSEAGLMTCFSEIETGFSGGEMRRISLARALINRPELLILDEPFAGLEQDLKERLSYSLRQWLRESGGALVVLCHIAEPIVVGGVIPDNTKIVAI